MKLTENGVDMKTLLRQISLAPAGSLSVVLSNFGVQVRGRYVMSCQSTTETTRVM
jgi:hypothetical protein